MVFLIFWGIVTVLAVAAFTKPSIAMVGVVCMFALEQWAQGSHAFFVVHRSFVNIIVGAIVVLGVLVKVISGRNPFRAYPQTGWISIALIGYAFMTLAWVDRLDISTDIWFERYPYIVVFILLAPLLVIDRSDFRHMYQGTLILGTLLTFLLLYTVEWNFRFVLLKGSDGNSVLGNPLAPAEVAGNVACIALFYRFKTWLYFWKFARWIIVLACLMLIVKSGSRGQLLGFFAALLVGAILNRKVVNLSSIALVLISATILAIGTAWMMDAFLTGTIGGNAADSYYDKYAMQHRWEASDMQDSYLGRMQNVLVLLEVWSQSFFTMIFGIGNSASYKPDLLGIYPHFVPGEILAEEGLVGLILYSFLLIVTFRGTVRTYRAVRTSDAERSILAITVTLFIYSLFISLKQGSLLTNLPVLLWATLLGRLESSACSASDLTVAKPRKTSSSRTLYNAIHCLNSFKSVITPK